MSDIPLQSKIEAVLFYKGEPTTAKKLAELLSVSPEEIEGGLAELESVLQGRGVQLVRNGDEVMLGTSAVASPLIEAIHKDEISRDLGKAGLETLAIVLYKGPISRREIDYIRGVNSAFILRNLLVRGLIERLEANPSLTDARPGGFRGQAKPSEDGRPTLLAGQGGFRGISRGYLYKPSLELISFMGLSKLENLPEFESVRKEMDAFVSAEDKAAEENNA